MGLLKLMGISLAIGLSNASYTNSQPPFENNLSILMQSIQEQTNPLRDSIKTLLDNNFLGKEVWKNNIEGLVIQETNLPEKITPAFLNQTDPLQANKKICENYILIFIPSKIGNSSLSINSFRDIANSSCEKHGKKPAIYGAENGSWYKIEEEFANNSPSSGEWHLVRKEIVPKSFSKNFEKQTRQIAALSELKIAESRALIVAIGMYYMNNGERIYSYPRCARTEDITFRGYRVAIGLSDTSGTNMLISIDYMRAPNVGLAVEWKLE